jgi:hypothetical protein
MEVPMKRLFLGLLTLLVILAATPQVLPKGGYVIKRWTITFFCDGHKWTEHFEGTRVEAERYASTQIEGCEVGLYRVGN